VILLSTSVQLLDLWTRNGFVTTLLSLGLRGLCETSADGYVYRSASRVALGPRATRAPVMMVDENCIANFTCEKIDEIFRDV